MADRTFGTDQRRELASKGQAMPDGSYPIPDKDALRRAVQSFGRGKGNKAALKSHIIKRAKALGAVDVIPDDWLSKAAATAIMNQVAVRLSYNMDTVRTAWQLQEDKRRKAAYDSNPANGLAVDVRYRYVREIWSDFVIVDDERNSGKFTKVSYTVSDSGDVAFGKEEPVKMEYVKASQLLDQVADRINTVRLDAASAKSQAKSKQGRFASGSGSSGGGGSGSSEKVKQQHADAAAAHKLHEANLGSKGGKPKLAGGAVGGGKPIAQVEIQGMVLVPGSAAGVPAGKNKYKPGYVQAIHKTPAGVEVTVRHEKTGEATRLPASKVVGTLSPGPSASFYNKETPIGSKAPKIKVNKPSSLSPPF